MRLDDAIKSFEESERRLAALRRAQSVLGFDGMTCAPKNSAGGRAQTLGALSRAAHGELLSNARFEAASAVAEHGEGVDEALLLKARDALREREKLLKKDRALLAEYSVLTGEAFAAWREAKKRSDFSLLCPYLERVVDCARRTALAFSREGDPVDYWLNENEEGLKSARLDEWLALVRGGLEPLLRGISSRPVPDTGIIHGHFPKYLQQKFTDGLLRLMGVDRARCAVGEAEHPYTTVIDPDDVRITTHYYEDNVAANMFSVLHEGGHAIYGMGIDRSLAGSALGFAASAGMNESQSRLYENMIGRTPAFAEAVLPLLREIFPERFSGAEPGELFRAVCAVRPTLKRTEADEVTYSLHIMVRHELEKKLLRGELEVRGLPDEWNRLYREYLGIEVPSDREGVLQDMHWPSGLFGYFPTYFLGNAYAAQIAATMRRERDVDQLVEGGDIPAVTHWLRTHIHRFGRTKTPDELIRSCCGGGFDPGIYVDYLNEKYGALYGL